MTTTQRATAEAKARPMLFSAPMVRALLAGTKTQTRRLVKPQPFEVSPGAGKMPGLIRLRETDPVLRTFENAAPIHSGDHIWVRETFAMQDKDKYRIAYRADGERVGIIGDGSGGWSHIHHGWVLGTADPTLSGHWVGRTLYGPWKPGIHMSRHMSRITLEVTGVRVERLHAITEDDAEAEGFKPEYEPAYVVNGEIVGPNGYEAKDLFRMTWYDINGHDSWDANHWVWVYSFRKLNP